MNSSSFTTCAQAHSRLCTCWLYSQFRAEPPQTTTWAYSWWKMLRILSFSSILLAGNSYCCRCVEFLNTLFAVLFTFNLSPPLPDFVLSSLIIQQLPTNILIEPEENEVRIECYHGDNNYPYMLWYQHKSAGGQRVMDLIGLLHYENPNLEKDFNTRFSITGHSKQKAHLVISNIKPTDSAEYFCAASQHSVSVALAALQKAGGFWFTHLHQSSD